MRLRHIEPVLRRALADVRPSLSGETLLVAVSGGADSTALLLGLHRLAPELGYRLAAAHLHHGLRGAEADADLEFVRCLCDRVGIPLAARRWNARARMRRLGLSGQDGLRRLRREFLEQTARRLRARAIVTAHTADDQLETLLLRLARGTGLTGLGGIPARRGLWLRPMLEAPRAWIEADLRAVGQPWREDGSNADVRYARNHVRHRVVPALLELSKGASRGSLALRAAAACKEAGAAARWLDHRAGRVEAVRSDASGIWVDCSRLRAVSPLIRRWALRKAWRRAGPGVGLTIRHLDALVRLTGSARDGRLDLPAGMEAIRVQGRLHIANARQSGKTPDRGDRLRRRSLKIPGRNRLAGIVLNVGWLAGPAARQRLEDGECQDVLFSAEVLEGKLELRPGKTDEWFVPFGRRRPRRLGEFLRRQRAGSTPPLVLADEKGILWVVGVRRSARAPVTAGTRKALWIHTSRS